MSGSDQSPASPGSAVNVQLVVNTAPASDASARPPAVSIAPPPPPEAAPAPAPAPNDSAPVQHHSSLRSRVVDDTGRVRIGRKDDDNGGGGDGKHTTKLTSAGFTELVAGKLRETKPSSEDEWWVDENPLGRERKQSAVTRHRPVIGKLGQDATGARFNWRYFVLQFFVHVLQPFSLPLYVWWKGPTFARNQLLLPRPDAGCFGYFRNLVGGNWLPLLWWSLIVVRAVFKPTGVSDVEFFLAIFGLVAHRLVLATKYALLTDEYTVALGKRLISANVHRNIELVTGWAQPSIEVCDRELRTAGRKLGIHLDRVGVILNKGDMHPIDVRHGASHDANGNPIERPSDVVTDGVAGSAAAQNDPLFGVGLATMDDVKYDPVIAPETPGPRRADRASASVDLNNIKVDVPANGNTAAASRPPAGSVAPAGPPPSLASASLLPHGGSTKSIAGAGSPTSAAPQFGRVISSTTGRQTRNIASSIDGPAPMLGSGANATKTDSKLFSKADEDTQAVLTYYQDRGHHASEVLAPVSPAGAGGAAGDMDPNQIRMSGLFLATRIVRELCINTPGARVTFWWAGVLAFAQATIPVVVRTGITKGSVFGSSEWSSIYLTVGCWFLTLFFTAVLVLFVLVGVADYFRRYALMKVLGVMIDPTASSTTSRDTAEIENAFRPLFIDLAIPGNIPSWFAIRQVIHEFGINYRVRIQLYTSYSLVLAICLFIVIIYNVFRGSEPDYVFISSVAFNSIMIFGLLAMMVLYGGRANDQYQVHKAILVRIQFAVREALAETMPYSTARHNLDVEYETLKQCDSLIESVLKCLEMSNSTNPVTILGVRASDQVFTALGTLAATAFGTASQALSK